jgi:predicted ATPase
MAKGKADKIITYFYNKAETHNGYFDEEEKIEKLDLRAIDKEDAAARVFSDFGHPSNFFDALESLFQIESLTSNSINLKVISKNSDLVFDFSQLSEGEQQLITVLGLILIAGREDCLFLLDEPDTHLNPIWQREYVKLLTDFNLRDDNSHIIVATHSPLIVQAADDETDIFLYKTNLEGEIVIDSNSNDLRIHNWRIDQVLASDYFQFENTRPPQLDAFMKEREDLLSKPVLTEQDIQRIKSFEEAEDLLPSGETLDDFKAMHLIHITANRIAENDKDQ